MGEGMRDSSVLAALACVGQPFGFTIRCTQILKI
jgi:hypothetical protein